MKTDQELRQEVERELAWDPSVRGDRVTVEVHQAAVMLHGIVAVYSERIAAERAALRIGGVVEVENQIGLQPVVADDPDDAAIGEALQHKLEAHAELQRLAVQASVDKRWLTLSGDLETWDQHEEALRVARNVGGIRGLTDHLSVSAGRPSAEIIRTRIRQTFERHGCSTQELPRVHLTGRVVTLVGHLPSDEERFLALEAVRTVEGVHTVRNCLDVEPAAAS
jgi:osmotically-inducible protein OsmY